MQDTNALTAKIRSEIAEHGVLPFARFMELALYCPDCGYYETKKDNVGRRGDFITSVSTGELFGQLLAFQFAEWLDEIKTLNPQPSTLNLIEAGAHDGRLAADILSWLQIHRPEIVRANRIRHSRTFTAPAVLAARDAENFIPNVRWHNFQISTLQLLNSPASFSATNCSTPFPSTATAGMRRDKKWFEWGVAVEGEKFVWARMPEKFGNSKFRLRNWKPFCLTATPSRPAPPPKTGGARPRAFWQHGKLLTIDYGLTADEMFSPSRTNGTLRAYFRHHVSDDMLANTGEQDLTAHVNFSALQTSRRSSRIENRDGLRPRRNFSPEILEKTMRTKTFGGWTPARTRQFQTLTHPEHLGRAFRVLVQSK